jgi:hypothetical protein
MFGYRKNECSHLKGYAKEKEKTVTQLIEDWIDRLPTQSALFTSVPPVS